MRTWQDSKQVCQWGGGGVGGNLGTLARLGTPGADMRKEAEEPYTQQGLSVAGQRRRGRNKTSTVHGIKVSFQDT